jgi:hypothetical protein
LIARTLVGRGIDVLHIRGTGAIESERELRAGAHQLSLLDPSLGPPPRPGSS